MERHLRIRSRGWVTALALVALATAGCASLEDRIAEPRSGSLLDEASLERMESVLGIKRHRFQVPDGPELGYRVVPTVAYGMEYRYARSDDNVEFGFNLTNTAEDRTPIPVTGTVVLLHGWGMDGSSMLPWALALAERGWHTIMLDLRNHGASGSAPAGYGPREGQDVAALVASLRQSGEIDGPLALFGISYGAVAALYAAAETGPDAIHAVVAMAPYANAADGIRGMINGMKAMSLPGLRGRLLLGHARRRYDDARIDRAIVGAGQRLGLELADIDVRHATAAADACILLLHGTEDGFFPMQAVKSLADAAPHGQLVPLQGEHHFTAPMRMDWLAAPLAGWLHDAAEGPCPAFALPPAPETTVAGNAD